MAPPQRLPTPSPTPPARTFEKFQSRLKHFSNYSIMLRRKQVSDSAATIRIQCKVNGRVVTLEAHPMARLLDVLREKLHLTGTKEGCGEGECGACSVVMDGALVNSCLVPALQADGTSIRTIEGVASNNR